MVSDRMKYGILPSAVILVVGSFGIYKLAKFLQHENQNRRPEFYVRGYPDKEHPGVGIHLYSGEWKGFKIFNCYDDGFDGTWDSIAYADKSGKGTVTKDSRSFHSFASLCDEARKDFLEQMRE